MSNTLVSSIAGTKAPAFPLGRVVCTKAVAVEMTENIKFRSEITAIFEKYVTRDWGDTDKDDKKLNDMAVEDGDRIVAAYYSSKGKIFVITEWDRSATTILFSHEY